VPGTDSTVHLPTVRPLRVLVVSGRACQATSPGAAADSCRCLLHCYFPLFLTPQDFHEGTLARTGSAAVPADGDRVRARPEQRMFNCSGASVERGIAGIHEVLPWSRLTKFGRRMADFSLEQALRLHSHDVSGRAGGIRVRAW
jgi:hypothetical protein